MFTLLLVAKVLIVQRVISKLDWLDLILLKKQNILKNNKAIGVL